jgi:hypothetical protein
VGGSRQRQRGVAGAQPARDPARGDRGVTPLSRTELAGAGECLRQRKPERLALPERLDRGERRGEGGTGAELANAGGHNYGLAAGDKPPPYGKEMTCSVAAGDEPPPCGV